MTDRENFLERWSRKKTESAREPENPSAAGARRDYETPSLSATAKSELPLAPTKPAFDLSKLPALDSITSATDVRSFLMPGVPPELTRAALRRAWAADPAIRDFVGLSENAWDFTDPNAMPGFGDIPAGYDLKRMVAEVLGELDRNVEPPTQPPDTIAEPEQPVQLAGQSDDHPLSAVSETGEPADQTGRSPATPASSAGQFLQRDSIAAPQNSTAQDDTTKPKLFRSHGRALPKV